MHPRKQQYSQEIYGLVTQICRKFSENKTAVVPSVLNISERDALEIIKKIIIALPDHYFYNANKFKLYDMITFISKNIVLFQIQENIHDNEYAYHLIDFINGLTSSIAIKYYQ
jgi:hypothetical protein